MAFQHCMDFLLAYGLLITTFISDRHYTTIASHMKNVLTNITYYFDIWHLTKSKDIPVFTIIVDCKYFCKLLVCSKHYASINSSSNHRPPPSWGNCRAFPHTVNPGGDLCMTCAMLLNISPPLLRSLASTLIKWQTQR